jgi:regulator of sigma E protease
MPLENMMLLISTKVIPFILALVGFGSLIAIHEFGHFAFAKLFGIHTPTFSIGFGPELFKCKIGRTNFRLALIPLGGYVEIAGLAEAGQGEQIYADSKADDSFDTKPYWQKLLVMTGGIIFNLLFAYTVFCALFMIGSSEKPSIIIAAVGQSSAAERNGLKAGDAIISVNNINLINNEGQLIAEANATLLSEIKNHPGKAITLEVERSHNKDGEKQIIPFTIQLDSIKRDSKDIGLLGADLRTPLQKLGFFNAITTGIKQTNEYIVRIVESIKKLFTDRSLEGAGGPVMIMSMSFTSAQNGILPLLIFLALISINLALLNLLPIGALDGGQILFISIEALIGRKLPQNIKNGLNIASWLLFISLAVFLTYKDIVTLFGAKIKFFYSKLVSLIQ